MTVRCVRVKSVTRIANPAYVGDIGVENNHNLFVSVGVNDAPMLVHNCWGLVSGDKELAGAFRVCAQVLSDFRSNPSPKTLKELELKGDIHRVNYNFFTGMPIEKIRKDVERQQAKGIVFGGIYGRSVNSIAKEINETKEKTQKIVDAFFKKFKRAAEWLDKAVSFSHKKHYMYSPTGRRRNLPGYIIPNDMLQAALERRAKNSPIQGFASELGFIAARVFTEAVYDYMRKFEFLDETKSIQDIGSDVMVHDSNEVTAIYDGFLGAIHIMEWAMIDGVREYVKRNLGFDFNVDLAVEFEIGASNDNMYEWKHFDINTLREIVHKSLVDQRDIIGYDIDPDKICSRIFKQYAKQKPWLDKRYPLKYSYI